MKKKKKKTQKETVPIMVTIYSNIVPRVKFSFINSVDINIKNVISALYLYFVQICSIKIIIL